LNLIELVLGGWQLIHHPFGNVNPEVLDLFKPNLCKNKDE